MRLVRLAMRFAKGILFLGFYLRELVVANALVAWEVITPRHNMRPGIIKVPIRCDTDLEISLLANLVTFTPGTLSLDVSEDRSVLFVHGLHVATPDGLRARVQRLEDRLLEVLR